MRSQRLGAVLRGLRALRSRVARADHEARPGDVARRRLYLRRVPVNRQPQLCQALDHGAFPGPQLALAVAEQRKVVDVAQVGPATRFAGALADAIGVAAGDGQALETRLDNASQRVMDDPIANGAALILRRFGSSMQKLT